MDEWHMDAYAYIHTYLFGTRHIAPMKHHPSCDTTCIYIHTYICMNVCIFVCRYVYICMWTTF